MSYARTAVTRMTLDMSRLDLQRSETVTLGDTNRRWEVTLINGGAPFRLPPNWTAAMTGIKPDGTGLLNGCSVADGKIVYDFAAGAEIATCAGNYPVQFDIWDEVGDLVASPKIYVNVLADVRPHAELDSEGQYTLIGDAIKKIDDMGKDVDLLADTALVQGDDIVALKEKVTTAGTITIPATEWTDSDPTRASFTVDGLVAGTMCFLLPDDSKTKAAAEAARISTYPEVFTMPTESGLIYAVKAEAEITPTEAMTFVYAVVKTETVINPVAALIGVDAYGGGSESGTGGVDEAAVKEIIKSVLGNVANERQYSEANPPPYPVTTVNGKSGDVSLNASDVSADPSGTAVSKVAAHNTEASAHNDMRILLQSLSDRLTALAALLNSDDITLDETKEIVDYIKSNKSLIDSITTSKVNVTDIIDNLTSNVTNKPLSAAQGVALKALIDALGETVNGKQTAEQVTAAINDALSAYLTSAKAAELYQPKGDYLTPETGDTRYAKPSDIPTVPDTLPNPKALTINGVSYDGSTAQTVNISAAGEETPSIVLPAKLYAVAGHEFVLYYRNILRAMRPEDFAVTTAFTSGSTLPNLKPLYDGYLRFTPAESHVGSHTLTIKVFSRRTWEAVATKSVTLVISSDKAISGKNVMYIGDSLTYASVYPAEIQNMSSDGIMSVGIISHSISFNGGTAAIKSEGRNSAASYDYVNDQTFAGYDNPFYNPDTEYTLTLDDKYTTGLLNLDNTGSVSVLKHHFDFAYYMANNGDTVGEPDAVFINLGTNGGNKSAYQAVFIAFDAMIERIKAYNADLPVFLHLFPPKSEAGSTDRTAGGTVSGWLNARTWYYDIIHTYIDRYDNDSRVTLVPTYTMLDPVYDYKRETVAVSARNTETVTIGQTDGTHPANPGYLHMADSYYNIMQAYWSGEAVDTYYTVTNNLTNVTNSNTASSVIEGGSYAATLTAASGYTLDTVSVTMGGEPVSVSGGTISISAVTGHIVITATAVVTEEEPTVENLVDPSKTGSDLTVGADIWVNGYYASSASAADTTLTADETNNPITTDHIPITDSAKIRIYGLDISKSAYKNRTKMVIGMSDGRIFRAISLPFTDTTDGSGATLLDTDGSLVVTVSKFGQAANWSGKSWARISGIPKDGNNSNIIVTVE